MVTTQIYKTKEHETMITKPQRTLTLSRDDMLSVQCIVSREVEKLDAMATKTQNPFVKGRVTELRHILDEFTAQMLAQEPAELRAAKQ